MKRLKNCCASFIALATLAIAGCAADRNLHSQLQLPSQTALPVAAQLSPEDRYREYITVPAERAVAQQRLQPPAACSFG